eukprot:GHUV01054600.1.p1 GENE.GHUV01054600.1~~GHUV01054600.1.p1  ORF type:complete len:121 (-),score=19.33 GHUV01054600.1:10-372(-)
MLCDCARGHLLLQCYIDYDVCWLPLLQVIKLISKVIADFANGEISQASSLFDTSITLQQYLDKSFYKTASLIAASCRSSAVFSGMGELEKQAMYDYGKHLGLAFQVMPRSFDFVPWPLCE